MDSLVELAGFGDWNSGTGIRGDPDTEMILRTCIARKITCMHSVPEAWFEASGFGGEETRGQYSPAISFKVDLTCDKEPTTTNIENV